MKKYLYSLLGSLVLVQMVYGAGWRCEQKNASNIGYHVQFYFKVNSSDTWRPGKMVVSKDGQETMTLSSREIRRTKLGVPDAWTGWRGSVSSGDLPDVDTAVFMLDWEFGDKLHNGQERDGRLLLKGDGEVIASHNLNCEDYLKN